MGIGRAKSHLECSKLRLRLFIALVTYLFFHSALLAETRQVVLLYENSNDHTTTFISSFNDRITGNDATDAVIQYIDVSRDRKSDWDSLPDNSDLVVALGSTQAERFASRYPKRQLLSCLVSEESLRNSEQLFDNQRYVRLIDQPVERYLHLVKASFNGSAPVIGRFHTASSSIPPDKLYTLAQSLSLSVENRLVTTTASMNTVIESLALTSQVLLLLPDSSVLSRDSAKVIFVSAYMNRVPIIGYSQSITRAGAVAAVYSTPEQLGRECAEHATKLLDGKVFRQKVFYPTKFNVSVNYRMAKLLGINIPTEQQLHESLMHRRNSP